MTIDMNNKKPACLGYKYIGDYTTQLFRDYKDPYSTSGWEATRVHLFY